MTPSANFVVAFPRIFGPKIENTVEKAARTSTIPAWYL
jgi:hypothetical protein